MAYTTIDKGSKYFNTVTWTGTGSAMSITGVGFQPDWVWYKGRSFAYNHGLFDAVRGTSNFIKSNSTDAETSLSGVSAFNSDGFSLGTDAGGVNSGSTYVAWNWLGANTTVSNTSGSITSTVSANTTSGFSIVSWTGTGSNSDQTLGTGLSTALDFIIAKPRDTGGNTDSWVVYASALNMTQNQCLLLESTSAFITGATSGTPNRGSTAGQLKLLAGTVGNQNLNASGLKYIAYCFHNVKGFSKFGGYTGNGSTDGTFVYTGFKPAFVIFKRSSSTGNWQLYDNKRLGYNAGNNNVQPNLSNAESTDSDLDILSNGFKLRVSGTDANGSGSTYIYMAFAENPFTSSKGIPTTAR